MPVYSFLDTLAKLGNAAYDSGSFVGNALAQPSLSGHWVVLTQDNLGLGALSPIAFSNGVPLGTQSFDVDGYYHFRSLSLPSSLSFLNPIDAAAYVAVDFTNHQLVLSFRGTEPGSSVGKLNDLITDITSPFGSLDFTLSGMSDFIHAATTYAIQNGFAIYTTGHSMGGALAELAYLESFNGNAGALAYAGGLGYGSPGVGPYNGALPSQSSFYHVARQDDWVAHQLSSEHDAVEIGIDDHHFDYVPDPFTDYFNLGYAHNSFRYETELNRMP